MSDKSKIAWCDATWQVVAGCTPVSDGCRNCYSARLCATRMKHLPWADGLAIMGPLVGDAPRWTGKVIIRPDKLDEPSRWKRPRKIFVGDRGDLFHEKVPGDFISDVFGIMEENHRHTFMVLTKRPERMREYLAGVPVAPNVWLGTSVENQKAADERIPVLLQCPAKVRFVSFEPLLGPIQLMETPDWGIIGCESGYGRRRSDLLWTKCLINRLKADGSRVFVKQVDIRGKVSKDPMEWPDALRVQEFPEVKP